MGLCGHVSSLITVPSGVLLPQLLVHSPPGGFSPREKEAVGCTGLVRRPGFQASGSQSLPLSTQVAVLVQWAENLLISRAFICRCPGHSALQGPVGGGPGRGVSCRVRWHPLAPHLGAPLREDSSCDAEGAAGQAVPRCPCRGTFSTCSKNVRP